MLTRVGASGCAHWPAALRWRRAGGRQFCAAWLEHACRWRRQRHGRTYADQVDMKKAHPASLRRHLGTAIGLMLLAAPCQAGAVSPRVGIVSPPAGAPADGPSDNTAFSQDNRDVRLLAYDSAADNLTPG